MMDDRTAILFLVDDNLFTRNFSLATALTALSQDATALGFSLRLGYNTTYCYANKHPQSLPKFSTQAEHVLRFDWPGAEGDFGYPLEVSSSIYLVSTLMPFLVTNHFRNPNELEGAIASRAAVFRQTHPRLLSFEQSVTFCNPINVVQTFHPNRVGEHVHYSVDALLDRFERGERVDVEAYNGFTPNACHQEVPLHFTTP
jgi:hypothetical protein